MRETHGSWVLLSGERAYKLKKPIVLPFLDYGTAERRREMCEEEVRLNRRLAEEIYLGVRGIAIGDGGAELVSPDDERAVDYVVEMRRYDEDATLAAHVAAGTVTRDEVSSLARLLARWHERAARLPGTAKPWLTVARRMLENSHELLALIDRPWLATRVLAVERSSHAYAVAHARLLDRRAREGWIRECHGDLRSEHVVLERGRQEIVDCIEFDRDLRELDVADDLAFLVMDLVRQGAEDLAEVLVGAYRDAGGDPGDDTLIAFYGVQRALVRAKVALLRARQHAEESPKHRREQASADELVTLAEHLAWRARLPLVIVVCGAPATGKSHLAALLAEASRLAHLSSDVTRKQLAGLDAHERAPAGSYTPESSRQTYAELARRTSAEVAARGGAIVDATFRRRADREAFATASASAAPTLFVECRAPLHVTMERARQRSSGPQRSASDATPAVVRRESSSWDPLDEVPPDAHVVVRTDRAVEAVAAELVTLLDERLGPLTERGREPETPA